MGNYVDLPLFFYYALRRKDMPLVDTLARMIRKPSSCIGCPFYTRGSLSQYYVPDTNVEGSEVFFLAQNPGLNEIQGLKLHKRHYTGYGSYQDEYIEVTPQPLIGATGALFDQKFLPLSGLKRKEISVGNAIRCRPGDGYAGLRADDLPKLSNTMKLETSEAEIVKALKHCREAHFRPPKTTKMVVTMGGYSLYQMTGQTGVTDWRGYGFNRDSFLDMDRTVATGSYHELNYQHTQIIVFATMHIAALFKGENKKYYHATLEDFNKIKNLRQGLWPRRLPTWSDIPPKTWPQQSAFDTEYHEDNTLIRWSLCDSSLSNLYCVEAYNTPVNGIPIEPGSTVLIQNALADIEHLSHIVDMSQIKIEDLMLAHSVLWTGEPHSLNYIASIYGAFNRYKHLYKDQEQLYSALDAYEPMFIWKHGIMPQFRKDLQSWRLYQKNRLPLIPIIDKSQQTGARLNGYRLREVQQIYKDRIAEIQETAREITGEEKFNIGGSKRLKELIYSEDE